MLRITVKALLLLALMAPVIGLSQPPREQRKFRDHRRGEIEQRVHTMKIWKLTEELELSEDQAAKFFPVMNVLDQQMEDIEKKRQEALEKLSDLVWDQKAEAQNIKQILTDLENFEEQQLKLKKQFRADVSDILEPDQLGKMVLFNMRFPEVIRGVIREFEDKQPPPGAPPPPDRKRDW